ncbi:monovalent cation/H+ antiporter complex subunit F [Sulfurovum sp. CS9]|uniref:monovalent cation/H+ antiporter complex subunit F n=1 Tax=Sulfurovum sp. CS9 TaxID=3391146 RepID=UPI0039E7CBAD
MFDIVIFLLLLSMLIILYRFLKGPTLSDRVVSFDVMSIMGVSLLVLLALYFQRSLYLDIALVFGLIGFLGATIFGRFIEKGL